MRLFFEIPDVYDLVPRKAFIEIGPGSFQIGFDGYGECDAEPGFGTPIVIEYRNGTPFVVIYEDINDPEYTQVISLENAAESKRKEDGDANADVQ